jgi:hypothetical protein
VKESHESKVNPGNILLLLLLLLFLWGFGNSRFLGMGREGEKHGCVAGKAAKLQRKKERKKKDYIKLEIMSRSRR